MNHEPSKFNLKNESVEHDFNYYDHQSLFEFMAMNDEAHAHNYYILSFLDEGSVSQLSDFDHKRISVLMLLSKYDWPNPRALIFSSVPASGLTIQKAYNAPFLPVVNLKSCLSNLKSACF